MERRPRDCSVKGVGRELRRVLGDHRELTRTLSDIDQVIDWSIDGAGFGACLEKRLRALAEHLRGHFRWEEEDGFYAALEIFFPHLAERLRRLAKDHGGILAGVEAAADEAHRIDEDRPRAAAYAARVRLALARLRRHEAEEDEALQEAYCDALGAEARLRD